MYYRGTDILFLFSFFRSRLPSDVSNCNHYDFLEDLYDAVTSDPGNLTVWESKLFYFVYGKGIGLVNFRFFLLLYSNNFCLLLLFLKGTIYCSDWWYSLMATLVLLLCDCLYILLKSWRRHTSCIVRTRCYTKL